MQAKQRRSIADSGMRTNPGAHRQQSASRLSSTQRGDWTDHEAHYLSAFRDAPYFSSGRNWMDYAPAYRYGYENYRRHDGRHFEDVEAQLQQEWETGRATSRLAWAEARGPIRDIWRRLEQDVPGHIGPQNEKRRRR